MHLASSKDYDAILLDWNLPRLDGLTVLRRIRKEAKKKVPIIMLTARDHLADKIDGAIGEGSQFHQTYGYYAQGVGPETAPRTQTTRETWRWGP